MNSAITWARTNYGDVAFDYINAHVPMFKETEVELHWRVRSMSNLIKNRRLQKWMEEHEEELLNLAKQIQVAQKEGEKLGLTAAELAFYDALTKPQVIKMVSKGESFSGGSSFSNLS